MKRFRIGTSVMLGLLIGTATQAEVVVETVTVGNPGNPGDSRYPHGGVPSFGGVDYVYNIGKYEVTAGQYTEFLNAVAATDSYGLYNADMWDNEKGCKIQRSGSSPNYAYSVVTEWADRPVDYVSWGDTARLANWLHNGQPTGAQDVYSTEDGSYDLSATHAYYGPDGEIIDHDGLNNAMMAVVRELNATWVVPSEDEWYKASYHKNDPGAPGGDYYDYPTSSDSIPGYVNNSGNLSGTGTAFTEGGTDPGNYATYDGDGEINGIGSPYYRAQVGEWENSGSPYGTFDQGGNVWEWNAAVISGSLRGLRGGAFGNTDDSARAAYRDIYYPSFEHFSLGFRVAEVQLGPVPTVSEWGVVTMVLLVLTAGSVVIRRQRRAA